MSMHRSFSRLNHIGGEAEPSPVESPSFCPREIEMYEIFISLTMLRMQDTCAQAPQRTGLQPITCVSSSYTATSYNLTWSIDIRKICNALVNQSARIYEIFLRTTCTVRLYAEPHPRFGDSLRGRLWSINVSQRV
jgi:hypothetical protein